MRSGSAGDPLRWYISQPLKCGPLTSHRSRLPSAVSTNAPLRVPTSTRTPLICAPFLGCEGHAGDSPPIARRSAAPDLDTADRPVFPTLPVDGEAVMS